MGKQDNFRQQVKKIHTLLWSIFGSITVFVLLLVYVIKNPTVLNFDSPKEKIVAIDAIEDDFDVIENGIHIRTGFVEGEGLKEVIQNCTNCHSAKLVIQNRMSKEQWQATIRWMQKTQNLWDLGDNEEIIINYLTTHYASNKKGRRQNLDNVEWYVLKDK